MSGTKVRPTTKNQSEGSTKFLKKQSDSFWSLVGLNRTVLEEKSGVEGLRSDARAFLASLGVANLVFLCEQASIPSGDKPTAATATEALAAESNSDTLVFLREFLRRRSETIDEVYDRVFTDSQRKAFDGDLSHIASTDREYLATFTKLLLLYRSDPENLQEVYFLQMWRSRPTVGNYLSDKALPKNLLDALKDKREAIAKCMTNALSKKPVRIIGIYELNDGSIIVAAHREFSPTIRRDYRNSLFVYYGCGAIIFGIHPDRNRLFLKTANKRLNSAIREFFQTNFKVHLTSAFAEVFDGYDPQAVESAFLGDYSEEHGLQITSAIFRRSAMANRPSMTITGWSYAPSIRTELKQMADAKILQIRSLDDIESLDVSYEGRTAKLTTESTKSGAVLFKFNDAGWSEDQAEEFTEQFTATFGVPLNHPIDPILIGIGSMMVTAHLLAVADEDEVSPFQASLLKRLLDSDIVQRQPQSTRYCDSPMCRPRKPILNDAIQTCPKCDKQIVSGTLRKLVRCEKGCAAFVGDFFRDTLDRHLTATAVFENLDYHPLRIKPDVKTDQICVLFRERMTGDLRTKLQRFAQPVIQVENHCASPYVYLDEHGMGKISLSYLITACNDPAEKVRCIELCRVLMQNLLTHHNERILTAGRQSFQRLQRGTKGDKGHQYQTDIYNVLRSFMPYCYQIARVGGVEPDGYTCVPEYGDDGLEGAQTWNWSYDAKHSDKTTGYDLNSGEGRKIVDYIKKFRSKLGFKDRSTKLRAHVIISNNMQDKMMAKAAKYVFDPESGIGEKNKDVRLVLMREEFVTELYQRINGSDRAEFEKRRVMFGNVLIEALKRDASGEGFTALSKGEATALMNKLLAIPPIEKAMTEQEFIKHVDAP